MRQCMTFQLFINSWKHENNIWESIYFFSLSGKVSSRFPPNISKFQKYQVYLRNFHSYKNFHFYIQINPKDTFINTTQKGNVAWNRSKQNTTQDIADYRRHFTSDVKSVWLLIGRGTSMESMHVTNFHIFIKNFNEPQ